MKNILIIAALTVAGFGFNAQASLYNISFTGNDGFTTATGQLDVSGNIVTSGYLNVTVNGVTIDSTGLVPVGATGEAAGGTNIGPGQDNVFNPNSLTQGGFLTLNGIIFYSGPNYADRSGGLMWLGDNSSSDLTPQLAGAGNQPLGFGGWLTPNTDGTLSVSLAAVPEPTTVVAGALLLLPFGVSTLRVLRKKHMA